MKATAVKERPILFSSPMIRAILRDENPKTQTRRVIVPQPDLMYRLTGDGIRVCCSDDNPEQWRCVASDTGVAEQRLHGWDRWADILAHKICGLWSEGIRGLVSVARPRNQEGIPNCFVVPQQHQGYEECSSPNLHSISRRTKETVYASQALGRKPKQQRTNESVLGHTSGELARSGIAWSRDERREASVGEIYQRRTRTHTVVDSRGVVQPKTGCTYIGRVAGINIRNCPFQPLTRLWVRETWSPDHAAFYPHFKVVYKADNYPSAADIEDGRIYSSEQKKHFPFKWRPSIHMPRWASRITLEITEVRVQRLQDISEDDAKAEGVWNELGHDAQCPWPNTPQRMDEPCGSCNRPYRDAFRDLWDSINAKRSPWASNPWVWALTFKRLSQS